LGLEQGIEGLDGQQLITQPAAEGFDMGFRPGDPGSM
jgi:hypothetical protein